MYNRSMTNNNSKTMIKENVSIFVTLASGKRYNKTYVINSDGAYNSVNNIVWNIVNRDFAEYKVSKFHWNYI